MNPVFKGEITELQVATSFLLLGYQVSKPITNNSRYDFIVDILGKLYKIQVKTSVLSDDLDYFEFRTSNCHTNTQKTVTKYYTKEDVDFFATHCNGKTFLVPIEKIGNSSFRLRMTIPKNGQIKGINFAEDYTIEKIISNLTS